MTVPENLCEVKSHGKDNLELITKRLDMTLPQQSTKLGDSSEGADSGFSSRASVVSMRDGKDGQTESTGSVSGASLSVSDDAKSPDKERPSTCNDTAPACCKLNRVPVGILKCVAIVTLLYCFICSLDLLGNAFQLLGGKAAGKCFSQSELLRNPITGLMMGILATVLLQSSSTSTSIIITMVSSGIIEVQPAIPIIMGCNIGTTVTNTLVSLAHSSKGKEFERAFAGATVHDVFNWLTVVVLLPLEASAHVLYRLTNAIISSADFNSFKGKKQDLLKTLTKPLTKLVVQVDKKVIYQIAENDPDADGKRILKTFCKYEKMNTTDPQLINETVEICDNKFHSVLSYYHGSLNDTAAGAILLVFSLIVLSGCLICLVKVLNSILKDRITVCLKKTINSKLPYPVAWLTGYLAILIGAGLTVIVQSSSVFTSALTPLVGVGCLKLRRMYPLTLGSNIGTTGTGILAALAAPASKMDVALQLALCHLFFNICGISMFYPIHPMRAIPINAAKYLGKTTAKYRWFAVFYLVVLFFLMPGCVFALSLAGTVPFVITLSILAAVVLFIIMLNILQRKCKNRLPKCLQTWDCLPKCLRSLEPLDKLIKKIMSIFTKCCKNDHHEQGTVSDNTDDNIDDDDDDEFDRENTAIEEDECTELFRKLCCSSNKSHKLKDEESQQADEGYSEPERQILLDESRTFHVGSPIFKPHGHKHHKPHTHVRLNLNNKLNVSPSATPLLQVVSEV